MATTLTISSTLIKRVIMAVAPVIPRPPKVPSHWSEVVLVSGNADGEVQFSCCDGYRLHEVTLLKGQVHYDALFRVVFGLSWLHDILKEIGRVDRALELTAVASPNPTLRIEEWETRCWTPPLFDPESSDGPRYEHPLSFDIGGAYPKTESLVSSDEITEEVVGFNATFFADMIKATMAWWNRDTLDAAYPLAVHGLSANKASSFSLRNSTGRLRVVLMPKITMEDEL